MSQTTQNTLGTPTLPAEVQYQPEGELPAVPSLADIDHFRVIAKDGSSQKATIAQIREAVGIDYSSLEEQIVPGEYWLGLDGNKKQVYTKSFIGRMPQNHPSIAPLSIGAGATMLSAHGCIETFDSGGRLENIPPGFGGEYNWKWYLNSMGIELVVPAGSTQVINKRFILTVKYAR